MATGKGYQGYGGIKPESVKRLSKNVEFKSSMTGTPDRAKWQGYPDSRPRTGDNQKGATRFNMGPMVPKDTKVRNVTFGNKVPSNKED